MADDYNRVRILRVIAFRAGEKASGFGLEPQRVEEVAGNHLAPNTLGLGTISDGENISNPSRHEIDQPQMIAKIGEVEVGGCKRLAVGCHVLDGHDAFGLRGSGYRIQNH